MRCDATSFLFYGMLLPYHLLLFPFLSLLFPSAVLCCLMLVICCYFITICRPIPRHFATFTASCKYSSRSVGFRILDPIGAHHTSITYLQLVPSYQWNSKMILHTECTEMEHHIYQNGRGSREWCSILVQNI